MAGKSSDNPNEFLLPDLGEGLAEAELVEWCVKPGQQVRENDTLARVETDKARSDVAADRDGIVKELHGNPGEKIKVGAPFVTYEGENTGSNGAQKPIAEAEDSEEAEAEHADAGTVVGSIAGEDYSAQPGQVRAVPK